MRYHDAVEKWIVRTTARNLDQHAADPIPAAAHLPASANQLRCARSHLLNAADELRTELINADDLTRPASATSWAVTELASHADEYESARIHVDKLLADADRIAYVATNPVQPVRRRYVNPGDTVLIVLPHLEANRQQQIAGRTVRARINKSDADLDFDGSSGLLRLSHGIAGIYRDPVEERLYVLRSTAVDEPTSPGH
jgi:hypothetical protein